LNLKNYLTKILKSPLLITVLPLSDRLVKFNKEKEPELLIVLDKDKGGTKTTKYILRELYKKEYKDLELSPYEKFQPLVLDFLGKSENQFIYMGTDMKRRYYSNGTVHDLNKNLKNEKYPGIANYTISIPHSSSFIDLNGDCIPDIVLTSYEEKGDNKNGVFRIEYWLFVKEEHYELYDCTEIKDVANAKDISQLVFADFGTLTLTQHRE